MGVSGPVVDIDGIGRPPYSGMGASGVGLDGEIGRWNASGSRGVRGDLEGVGVID